MGRLYLVSTPIGNLEDITLRAIRVLNSVDYVLCEDTRETGKLLKAYQGYQVDPPSLKLRGAGQEYKENRVKKTKQIDRRKELQQKLIARSLDYSAQGGFARDDEGGTLNRGDGKGILARNDEENVSVGKFPKLVSYNDYNRAKRIPWVIEELKKGKDFALVADRGTPLVSDPGYKLVQEVLRIGADRGQVSGEPHPNPLLRGEGNDSIRLEVVPGASAVLVALVVSGLPPDKFMFVGFLPKKSASRKKLFKSLPEVTIVAYEAPYRLKASLSDLQSALGDVEVAVCVELTKMHERVYRGRISEVIEEVAGEGKVKGEVTVVFRGNKL